MIQIGKGDRVKLNPKHPDYKHFSNLGNGWGRVRGFNPFHPDECCDVEFDSGQTICNVKIKDLDLIELDKVS